MKSSTIQSHSNISNISQTSTYRSHDIEQRNLNENTSASDSIATERQAGRSTGQDEDESLWSRSMKPSSTYSQLSSQKPRKKYVDKIIVVCFHYNYNNIRMIFQSKSVKGDASRPQSK